MEYNTSSVVFYTKKVKYVHLGYRISVETTHIILDLMSGLDIEISHQYREGNQVADKVAKRSKSEILIDLEPVAICSGFNSF